MVVCGLFVDHAEIYYATVTRSSLRTRVLHGQLDDVAESSRDARDSDKGGGISKENNSWVLVG